MRTQCLHRLIAIVLSAFLMSGQLPVTVMAADRGGETVSFEELEPEVAAQSVTLATSEVDLNLPEMLKAEIRSVLDSGSSKQEDAESEEPESSVNSDDPATAEEFTPEVATQSSAALGTSEDSKTSATSENEPDLSEPVSEDIPVTWTSSPEFDGNTAGEYRFTPKLPEGYTLADGVALPDIDVNVGEQASQNRLAVAAEDESLTLSLDDGDIVITSTGYSVNGGTVQSYTGDYIITQNGADPVNHCIIVKEGTHNITLKNVHAQSTTQNAAAFEMLVGVEVSLTLEGVNSLDSSKNTSGSTYAGLEVGAGSKVNIDGDGALTATGGFLCPGIGGSIVGACRTIIITGGNVTATGGGYGAGIGGSIVGACRTIIITGGNVTATGGGYGAGIGGGIQVAGVTVKISGENTRVTATGSDGGKDIGSGKDATDGGTLSVSDGATVIMSNVGTNATKPDDVDYMYTDCKISIGGSETTYDANGQEIITKTLSLSDGDIKITSKGYSVNGGTVQSYSGDYIITQNGADPVNHGITVTEGTHNITLKNVHAQPTTTQNAAAFNMYGGAEVSLTLEGDNSLDSSQSVYAGLIVEEDCTVLIDGDGSLTARGAKRCAGIGAPSTGYSCGTVTINSGMITAISSIDLSEPYGGAGIGGAWLGAGGSVTINGGTVMATGGRNGAGIGGGMDGAGGTVTISGGSVKATSDTPGIEAIGKGYNGSSSGTLKNGDGKDIYLTTITLPTHSADSVSGLSVSSGAYGCKDMQADQNGKLYLYLPADENTTVGLTANGNSYTNYHGSVTSAGSPNVLKMDQDELTLTVKSAYKPGSEISPTVAGGSGSGEVKILYKEAQDADNSYSETVPTAIGSYVVKAIKAGDDSYYEVSSEPQSFKIKDLTPTITSVTPSSGKAGDIVTIRGTNFDAMAIKFGEVAVTHYSIQQNITDTVVMATVPAGSGTVHIKVTTDDGTSVATTADQFTYLIPITQITVNSQLGTDKLTLGKSLLMLADVSPSDASNKDVTWSIEEGSDIASISADGTLTANDTKTGKVIVKATAKDDSGIFGSKEITVVPIVDCIKITSQGGFTSVAKDNTLQLWAKVEPPEAIQDIIWLVTDSPDFFEVPYAGDGTITKNADGSATFTGTKVGTIYVQATATDGSNVNSLFKITVADAPTGAAPTITSTTLSDAKVGVLYHQQLAADGDVPITWSLANGTLPSGLTLSQDGTISGTPTAKGKYNITVQASNNNGKDVTPLSLTVSDGTPTPAVPTVTSVSPSHGKAGDIVTIRGTNFSNPSGVLFGSFLQKNLSFWMLPPYNLPSRRAAVQYMLGL